MSISVTLSGGGAFDGAASAISGYSVTEESTPVVLSDTSGGVGQLSFEAVDDTSRKGSKLMARSLVTLNDVARGVTTGTITGMSGSNGLLSVTADTTLGRLVATRSAAPFHGTFGDAIQYYFSLVGISSFIVDSSVASKSVNVQGWDKQDLWTKIKELCSINGAEIALVSGTIMVRPVRQFEALPLRNATNINWEVGPGPQEQSIQVSYYNTSAQSNYLVVPEGGWTIEDPAQVLQVEANEQVTTNFPVNMWVTSVQQPVAQDNVALSHSTSSVYSIAGNDGFTVSAASWTAAGGRVVAQIGEDKKSIDVIVTGPRKDSAISTLGPFRLAKSSESEYYSTLRVVASGTYFKEESVRVYTGLALNTGAEDGASVSSIFVRTQAEAFRVGLGAATVSSAMTKTVSFSVPVFKTVNAVPQTFGYVAGSRVRYRRAIYRVRSSTITESTVEYTAEDDTTFDDFEASAAGMTFDDFEAQYAGLTFDDFEQIPLPTVKTEYDEN